MIPYQKLCHCFRIVRELTPKYREEFEDILTRLREMPNLAPPDVAAVRVEYQTSRAGRPARLKAQYLGNRFHAAIFGEHHDANDEPDLRAEHPADVIITIAEFIRDKQKAEHWIEHDLELFDHMCMELLTGPTLQEAAREAGREDDDRSVSA